MMITVSFAHLLQSHIHAPIRRNVRVDGSPTGRPGVTAVVAQTGGLGWCLLCDHPENPGVSVTNGAQAYAGAVCRSLACDISDLVWYQIDSMGKFDELHLMGASVGYAPLLQEGYKPRSMEAFYARARQLAPGLPVEAAQVIAERAQLFHPS